MLAKDLSKGELGSNLPASDNPITGDLRSLHGSISHLIWQANQIAKGDYSQRLDFMGELSDVFNTMIGQLETRENQLNDEINDINRKNQLLKQGQELLATLTDNMIDWVCVLGDDGTFHYFNKSCEIALDSSGPQARDILVSKLIEAKSNENKEDTICWELSISSEESLTNCQYFSLLSHKTNWNNSPSTLYILKNITREQESQELAFQDPLTALHNRRYGMQYIENCIEEGVEFNIAFIDIDLLKSVNDNHGHKAGDEYIIATANTLLLLPKPCKVFRIGGDEFLIVSLSKEPINEQLENLRNTFIASSRSYLRSFSYGVVKTEDVVTLIDEIAQTTMEQSEYMNQMGIALDQISAVVEENSANAEESAAASEELSSQSKILKEYINRFNLKK